MALNPVIDNGKQQRKLSYKILKEKYGFDPFIDISIFPTLNQFTYFLGGIQYFFQLLVSEFLTKIFYFFFLSLVTIWTTVSIVMTKQKEIMVTQ